MWYIEDKTFDPDSKKRTELTNSSKLMSTYDQSYNKAFCVSFFF